MTFYSALLRSLAFLAVTMSWYFGLVLLALPLTILYVYYFRAYELVLLGLLLDAYFLTSLTLPQYTLGFASSLLLVAFLKPRLRQGSEHI